MYRVFRLVVAWWGLVQGGIGEGYHGIQGSFGRDDGYVHCLRCGDSFMDLYICQNFSICRLCICAVFVCQLYLNDAVKINTHACLPYMLISSLENKDFSKSVLV